MVKRLFLISMLLSFTNISMAEWISMYMIDKNIFSLSFEDGLMRCIYSTNYIGSDLKIIIKSIESSSCPDIIKYNPETNMWRE